MFFLSVACSGCLLVATTLMFTFPLNTFAHKFCEVQVNTKEKKITKFCVGSGTVGAACKLGGVAATSLYFFLL